MVFKKLTNFTNITYENNYLCIVEMPLQWRHDSAWRHARTLTTTLGHIQCILKVPAAQAYTVTIRSKDMKNQSVSIKIIFLFRFCFSKVLFTSCSQHISRFLDQ